jgi:hypothetical protein
MTQKENATAPAWEDPDDAPDLAQPEWAEKLANVEFGAAGPPNPPARSPRPSVSMPT